jgi:iron(III) transport system substrate-binding protein
MNKRALMIPVVLMSAMLAACGSPVAGGGGAAGGKTAVAKIDAAAQKVFDELSGLTGQERTDKLVKMAEEEGELSVYTSNTDMQDIIKAFEDTYKVKVNVYRGNSESVLQRVLQESEAGFKAVDLVETNSGELNIIAKEGLFYPYKSELRDAVRKEGQKEFWTADRFNAFVVAWNTDKVKPGSEPTSLEAFADPSWKGRVSMEVGDTDWFATMYDYYLKKGKSEAEVDDLFAKIAANSKTVKGHTVQAELLSAGEFAAGVSLYSHSTDKAEKAGQPVTWRPSSGKPVQPIVIRPNGAGLIGRAVHPAAAVLFMDFLLSEGQKNIADAKRIGSVPGANDPLAGLEIIEVDESEMLDNLKKWDDKYSKVVQGGEKKK